MQKEFIRKVGAITLALFIAAAVLGALAGGLWYAIGSTAEPNVIIGF